MKPKDDTIYHLPTYSHPYNDANERMPVIPDDNERKEWIELNKGLHKTKKKTKKNKKVV